MASNHDHVARIQLRGGVEYVVYQALMGQFLQHFRGVAFHAGSFARSHDHDVNRMVHVLSLLFAATYAQNFIQNQRDSAYGNGHIGHVEGGEMATHKQGG